MRVKSVLLNTYRGGTQFTARDTLPLDFNKLLRKTCEVILLFKIDLIVFWFFVLKRYICILKVHLSSLNIRPV